VLANASWNRTAVPGMALAWREAVEHASGTLLVVSPHLDDAVFGCGDAVRSRPGSLVVTVFAGGPQSWATPTTWDAAAGFGPGVDAISRRRREDREALALLGADPVWLPFWDSQYGHTPEKADVTAALADTLVSFDPSVVLIPFGLWHSDHRLVHEAAVALLPHHRRRRWVAYEDAIYRRFPDAGLEERRADLQARGIATVPLPSSGPASAGKRRSLACYRSQLRALSTPGRPGAADALEPERHWALVPASGVP
jgi:LmbE family N-acetylglucosaminyl deacetylase